ncbi:MAG: hypothetical protein SVV80_10625 [Planctomycetota bacterium]|nr:hypothetical protein [Planctomycetota bacterium]
MFSKTAMNLFIGAVALLLISSPSPAETHWEIQTVDANGVGTFSGSATVIGVILNNHENMLDSTYNAPGWMGAQWQIFIQSVEVQDYAGTACWMGQKYGNFPFNPDIESYTEAEWAGEMNRLNYDPGTGHHFRRGDLVQVAANFTGFYGGKTNINEGHKKSVLMDFDITLVQSGYGLPTPEVITLAMVMDPDDGDANTHEDIFDQTRLSGGEYYQGRYVRINELTIVDSSGWGQEAWGSRICTVTDGTGRIFKLRMPRGSMVDLGDVPTGEFDVIGIFNQESDSGADGTFGYELYVTEVIPEPACVSLLTISGLALLRRKQER